MFEEQRNRRDFVGFFGGGDLAQGDAFLAGPGTDDVHGTQALSGIVRAATGLAVDGDESLDLRVIRRCNLSDPVLETELEGLRLESHEQSADAVARRDAVGQCQDLVQPIGSIDGPTMNGGGAIAIAQDAADRDDDDVAEQMFTIARVSRIGQRLKEGTYGFHIDELGHGNILVLENVSRGAYSDASRYERSSRKNTDQQAIAQAPYLTQLCALAVGGTPTVYWLIFRNNPAAADVKQVREVAV